MAKPLKERTKNVALFNWTLECEEIFALLKNKFCEPPVLKYPDYSNEFLLTTGVSNEGLEAILTQERHPRYYFSRTLNDA